MSLYSAAYAHAQKEMVTCMQERRKHTRIELNATLSINRLDDEELPAPVIEVEDVSRTGIGFYCDKPLRIGSVYEAVLTIWTEEKLHCFLRITRMGVQEDSFFYGALFIGMTEMDATRIDVYQTVRDHEHSA
jgi:hypothetical protein